jgi:uncharacterized membrane protein
MFFTTRRLNAIVSTALLALIMLCLVWESWLAPLRPGGSWMMLKAVPLLFPLRGILHGRRYTYQWSSMLVLLYLTEGVVRATDPGWAGVCAQIETLLSLILFAGILAYARNTRPSRQQALPPQS